MYDDLMSRFGDSLAAVGSNVCDLHAALERHEMPQPVRDDAQQVWSEFFWTWKDVREEEIGLLATLGRTAGRAANGNANPDPRVAVDWMSTWLRETIDSGNALVSRLDEASRKDPALGSVYMLVAGFQADVVNANEAMQEALQELGSRLDAQDSATRAAPTDTR